MKEIYNPELEQILKTAQSYRREALFYSTMATTEDDANQIMAEAKLAKARQLEEIAKQLPKYILVDDD